MNHPDSTEVFTLKEKVLTNLEKKKKEILGKYIYRILKEYWDPYNEVKKEKKIEIMSNATPRGNKNWKTDFETTIKKKVSPRAHTEEGFHLL